MLADKLATVSGGVTTRGMVWIRVGVAIRVAGVATATGMYSISSSSSGSSSSNGRGMTRARPEYRSGEGRAMVDLTLGRLHHTRIVNVVCRDPDPNPNPNPRNPPARTYGVGHARPGVMPTPTRVGVG